MGPVQRSRIRDVSRGEHGALQEIGGKIKNRIGALFGNRRAQAEGRAAEIKGEERQRMNRPSAPSFP